MHIHHHCSQIFHFFNEFLGINNHQMYIQRFFRQLGYIFQYRKTKRNIRYKHTIHYINMQPVGITTIYLFYICLQISKIGRQQRRGYQRSIHGSLFLFFLYRTKITIFYIRTVKKFILFRQSKPHTHCILKLKGCSLRIVFTLLPSSK